MALRLNGSTSGYVEIDVPAAAGSHTLTLPDGGGSSGQYLQTNGSGGLSWQTVSATGQINSETAQTISGSPAVVSFTGLPANIRRLVVSLNNVDPTGGSLVQIQLGTSSAYKTSGYDSHSHWQYALNNGTGSSSTGFHSAWSGASSMHGIFEVTRHSGNIFIYRGQQYTWDGSNIGMTQGAGSVDLGGELERVQLAFNATDTFASGSVNVHWEL
jgi:hypothetical protein